MCEEGHWDGLGSDHLTSRGGGGGVLVRLEYFFTCFQRQKFFSAP